MVTTVFERYPPADTVVEHALTETRPAVLWLDELPLHRPHRTLSGDVVCDLAVVGGGLTGLWTAVLAKLRDPARRVAVLEARRIGWAASGRSAGIVDASLTRGEANARARWPDEVDTLERLGRENLDALEADLERMRLDVAWERSGTLEVATEQHQLAWLEGGVRDADGSWPDVVRLGAEETHESVDSPGFLGASWRRRDSGTLHPGLLVAELVEAAERAGVEFFEQSPARALLDTASGVEVVVDGGRLRAGQAVLATGPFPPLLRRGRWDTVPVYGFELVTEPLSSAQLESVRWTDRQAIRDLASRSHHYRLTPDDRILIGGHDVAYHYGGRIRSRYEDDPEVFRMLAAHFFTTFPQLEGVRFTHRWAGVMDCSTRSCGFYGTARRGRVAFAAGFSGAGLGPARFAAEVMLDLLSGQETERTETSLVRERTVPHPPEPATWAGVQATLRAMAAADAAGRRGPLLRGFGTLGLGPAL